MSRVCLAQYSLFFFLIVVLVAHHAPAGCVAEHAGSHPATAIQENARHGCKSPFYVIVGCLHEPVWYAGSPALRPPAMGRMACGHFTLSIL